jgi:D-alanine-D-alanine ligase
MQSSNQKEDVMKQVSLKEKPNRGRNIKKAVSLGPVSNLEEKLRPEWWREIFKSSYLKTDADVVDDIEITRQEVNLITGILKLSPENQILDLCCGQGRHSLELARRGFTSVEGLDRSRYLIHRARDTAKSEGLNLRFREGDARKIPHPSDTFDFVMILGNSFGYFETIQDDLSVMKEVFRVLKPWGSVIIDVSDGKFVRENFQPRTWEWIDKKHFVCRERSLAIDEERLISREIISHVEKGVISDQFYAERLYTEEKLTRLLETANFSDIAIHGKFSTDSKRNQDLGMMEQRILLTAIVRKEWTPQKRRPKEVLTNILVVLGDPERSDPLKPCAIFDDDDFYTIDQMKSALRDLKSYKFTYLSDHRTLLRELTKMRGKVDFIFNLCDEGYENDPKKELHVPAIAEILGIPYTGSGPQCLAYCYDKSLIRGIANEMGIPVPEAFFIELDDAIYELPFPFPVIIKPNFGDSSFGITQKSVATNIEEVLDAISAIRERFGYDKPILLEEFLTGKDLTVGIIGNSPESYNVLPIIEEDYSALPEALPKLCGYEAKWLQDSPYWRIKSVPANLPEEMEKSIVEWSLKLFERLECRDYARFDWRVDSHDTPKLLEVNPNPGWCWDGHLAKMAGIAGISYGGMLEMILEAAKKRSGL